jgi:hypothetical protein
MQLILVLIMLKITVAFSLASSNDAVMEQTAEFLSESSAPVLPQETDASPSVRGGKARMNELTPDKRRALGRKAAQARWGKDKNQAVDEKAPRKRRKAKFTVDHVVSTPNARRETRVFGIALMAAEKRLARAIEERARAAATWAVLNAEIPSLQRTIAALRNQQNPNTSPQGYEMTLPDGSGYQPNASYGLPQVISDAPVPLVAPQQAAAASARALAASRVGGGAVESDLGDASDDEDKFLNASGMAGGNWH